MPRTPVERTATIWPLFAEPIVPQLAADDDLGLWQVAIETVIGDAEAAFEDLPAKVRVVTQIGYCSHWLAPNKARWITADGEFTWPSGYLTKAGFFGGLPEFDWYLLFERDANGTTWRHIPKVRCKRPLILRVSIPARTGLHQRASIHAIWAPGPNQKLNLNRLFYGFRKTDSIWRLRAYRGPKRKMRVTNDGSGR